jgi:hypothetical protein
MAQNLENPRNPASINLKGSVNGIDHFALDGLAFIHGAQVRTLPLSAPHSFVSPQRLSNPVLNWAPHGMAVDRLLQTKKLRSLAGRGWDGSCLPA